MATNSLHLEKVEGEYQGACFPFREGFASAVIRMEQGTDGSVFVGLSNRGWSSLGTAAYGLQRLVWTGKTPFEIKELRARPDGFEIVFTQPVDSVSGSEAASYTMSSHTYTYHSTYAVPILNRSLDPHTALYVVGFARAEFHDLRTVGVSSLRAIMKVNRVRADHACGRLLHDERR